MKHPISAMSRRAAYFVAATVVVLLAGCSTTHTFPSQVTVFSEWPGDAAGKSYAFARTPAQEQSLEHKTYEAAVREVLASKGFVEATGPSGTQLKVAISYGVTQDKNVREVYYGDPYPWPFYPYVGFGYRTRHWGAWGSSGFWPYGPVVYRGYEVPWFSRELKIEISDAATGAKRYEATARNDSHYDTITKAVPYLARAALDGFPQANGSVRVVQIPVPELVKEAAPAPAQPASAPAK